MGSEVEAGQEYLAPSDDKLVKALSSLPDDMEWVRVGTVEVDPNVDMYPLLTRAAIAKCFDLSRWGVTANYAACEPF